MESLKENQMGLDTTKGNGSKKSNSPPLVVLDFHETILG